MRLLARIILPAALFLSAAAPSAAQSSTRYRTTAVTLRMEPSRGARAVTQVPRARAVQVSACARAWCAVAYGRARGYVQERYLREGGGQTAVAEPPRPAQAHVGRGYVNSDGQWVPSPRQSTDGRVPAGATARCRDGTYSFSQHRRGTCSHHGGVAEWY
jgi:uncharacterized protein YraI